MKRYHRNPWIAERPSNWSSMSKADRRAWNRANWKGGGDAAPTPRSGHPIRKGPRTSSKSRASGGVKSSSKLLERAQFMADHHHDGNFSWDDRYSHVIKMLENGFTADDLMIPTTSHHNLTVLHHLFGKAHGESLRGLPPAKAAAKARVIRDSLRDYDITAARERSQAVIEGAKTRGRIRAEISAADKKYLLDHLDELEEWVAHYGDGDLSLEPRSYGRLAKVANKFVVDDQDVLDAISLRSNPRRRKARKRRR